MQRAGQVFFVLLFWLGWLAACRAETLVQVVEPYADVHRGPGSAYPVFHVVEQGEWIGVLKRRTQWFKVRLGNGTEGWISRASLTQTLNIDAKPVVLFDGSFEDFRERTVELAVFGGQLESVSALSLAAAWVWTENLAAEISYTQALGDFSENQLLIARIQHSAFPEWRLSPYISLGAGIARTTPRANLVQSGDDTRDSDLLEIGAGLRYYLNRNFILRLEYKNLLALTDRDEQEELNEWKLGFAVYF